MSSAVDEKAAVSEAWEPWLPQVGDRVRVRLSGECRIEHDGEKGHPAVIDGATGVVTTLHAPLCLIVGTCLYADQGHGYFVDLDVPVSDLPDEPTNLLVGTHLAAIELEPLDDR